MRGFLEKLMSKDKLKDLEKEQLANISDVEKILLENKPLPKGEDLVKRYYSDGGWKNANR